MEPVPPSTADAGPVFNEKVSRLLGIYEAMPAGAALPSGSMADTHDLGNLPMTDAARQQQAAARQAPDPKDLCQVLGPFRFMMQPDIELEVLRDAPNKLVLLFNEPAWGHLRTISIDAVHAQTLAKARPLWNGDSIAKWQGDTLEIDSVHFTNRTWLNDAAVVNSRQLHLTEDLRLTDGGRVLEYRATATDPMMLTRPISYIRYFRRTRDEIRERECVVRKAGK